MMLLEGLRVLDISRVLAGPLAAQILGDLGADVLKIEAPAGDDTRRWGPPLEPGITGYFQSCNRNKTSLVLNLKDDVDRERLYALAAQADVVIDNFQPNVREKLGVTAEDLRGHNPTLVWCGISGYTGDRASRPGYDLMVQAEAGLMGISGPAESSGFKVGVAVCDVMTGMMAANGILAALWRRERTGQGAALNISLYRTALFSLVNVSANVLASGEPAARWGNAHANIVPYQDFTAKDGPLVIGTGNDRQFCQLCKVLGVNDPTVVNTSNPERLLKRQHIVQSIQEKVASWQRDDLLAQLNAANIPAAPILKPEQAIATARVWDSNAVVAVQNGPNDKIEMINAPLEYLGNRKQHLPPPRLDEGGAKTEQRWLESVGEL